MIRPGIDSTNRTRCMALNRRLFAQWGVAACAMPGETLTAGELIVFAAASLTEVLQSLAATLPSGRGARFSFAASSTLARQIEQGAPAHLFISADEAWMDHLAQRKQIDVASRRVLAGNRLVVVRRDAPAVAEVLETSAALRQALRANAAAGAPYRVATGDPAHVPAGRYAQLALTRLGLWDEVAAHLVRADNVRSALVFVERGEAAAGIVYATDALATRKVQVVARFPRSSHPPIRYPAALVTGAPPAARAFLDALAGPQAQSGWRAAGFEPVA
jgi:molybdate transport system substrate-binding protein